MPELNAIAALNDMGSADFRKREAASERMVDSIESLVLYYPLFVKDPEVQLRVLQMVDSYLQFDKYPDIFYIHDLDYDVIFWYYRQEYKQIHLNVKDGNIEYEPIIGYQATRRLVYDQFMSGVSKETISLMIDNALQSRTRWQYPQPTEQ